MTVTRSRFYLDLPKEFSLTSKRLDIVPANHELADMEWNDRERLAEQLSAHVPELWPPELVEDHSSPNGDGWWDWYVISKENDRRVLIGIAGLKGWPSLSSTVQVGCAFLPEFRQLGYGTEAVDSLTTWALSQPHVDRVFAETPVGNQGATSILRSLGFEQTDSSEASVLRFEISRQSKAGYPAR